MVLELEDASSDVFVGYCVDRHLRLVFCDMNYFRSVCWILKKPLRRCGAEGGSVKRQHLRLVFCYCI